MSANAPRNSAGAQVSRSPADKHLVGFSRSRHARGLAAAALAAALGALLLALAPGVVAHPFHPGADRPVTKTAAFGGLELVRVGSFDFPVYLTSPRGDTSRRFVVEQMGRSA